MNKSLLENIKTIPKALALPFAGVFFVSCATVPDSKTDPDLFYDRNVMMTVNGVTKLGSVVVPVAADYKIKLKFPTQIDFLLIRTCHREEPKKPKDNDFEFIFTPTPIEASRACPMKIIGVEKSRKHRAFGFIDREDPRYSLPIKTECNAKFESFNGVGQCTSGVPLIQKFIFENPVEVEIADKKCDTLKTLNKKEYEFQMVRGDCSYYFYEPDNKKRIGRVTTYGYDEILTVIE